MKIGIKKIFFSLLGLLLFVIYPCLFMYFQNAGEASFKEVIGIIICFSLSALLLCGVLNIICHNLVKAVLISEMFFLFFLNFSFFERTFLKIGDGLCYWHIVLILLFFWIVAGILIKALLTDELTKIICNVIFLVFLFLIIMNAILATPNIVNKIKNANQNVNENITVVDMKQNSNFYLFIFDEYAGPENLKRYCNYDNAEFYNSLKELGFNVSYTSHNETYETVTVVPNLLNLNYLNAYMGGAANNDEVAIKASKMKNPLLYQIMFSQNYDLNILDAGTFLDDTSCKYRYEKSINSVDETPTYYILQNTALYPFYKDRASGDLQNMHAMIEYAIKSSTLQSSNLFTVAYFCNPHVPWFVDENGHEISGLDRMNYRNSNVYLGQLKYLNKCLIPMFSEILQNDPDCVIMIVGDHGYRQVTHVPDMFDDISLELPYLTDVLNAVYFKGEYFDIEGYTGINTLRKILNSLFDLNMLPIDINEYSGV